MNIFKNDGRLALRRFASFFVLGLVFLFVFSSSAAAQGIYQPGTVGVDLGYPNCKTSVPKTAFGVIGVTGGIGFQPNSCMTAQAAHISNLSLYINTGYPGQNSAQKFPNSPKVCTDTDLGCLAYNYGYNAGLYALNYASSQGVSSSTWWLDVETLNSWTNDPAQNIQSLQGQTDALTGAGVSTVGVYSTTYQWGVITGGWKNSLPNWGASTWNTPKQAATYCTGHNFTGGPTYLIQYRGKAVDQDYAC